MVALLYHQKLLAKYQHAMVENRRRRNRPTDTTSKNLIARSIIRITMLIFNVIYIFPDRCSSGIVDGVD